MDHATPLAPTAAHLLRALESATHLTEPFDHWLLADVLPMDVIEGIAALPFAPPAAAEFNGRREANNSTRVYFNPENQSRFEVCARTTDAFNRSEVMGQIEAMTGTDLSEGRLRIEYCQDVDGFWLEPHLDISVKLFTMLVYLSDDPALYDAGTDIFDASPEHNKVGTAPYEQNKGLIFIPGTNTWHGFSPRTINGVRKSIIINWVTSDWRATHELC